MMMMIRYVFLKINMIHFQLQLGSPQLWWYEALPQRSVVLVMNRTSPGPSVESPVKSDLASSLKNGEFSTI